MSPLRIISYSNNDKVSCNNPEIQANSPVLFCCIDGQLPLLTGNWKVNGAINITGEIYKRLPFTAWFACLSETSCSSAAASPEVWALGVHGVCPRVEPSVYRLHRHCPGVDGTLGIWASPCTLQMLTSVPSWLEAAVWTIITLTVQEAYFCILWFWEKQWIVRVSMIICSVIPGGRKSLCTT